MLVMYLLNLTKNKLPIDTLGFEFEVLGGESDKRAEIGCNVYGMFMDGG